MADAKPPVDPALVPFLDALAELLVAALVKDEPVAESVVGPDSEVSDVGA